VAREDEQQVPLCISELEEVMTLLAGEPEVFIPLQQWNCNVQFEKRNYNSLIYLSLSTSRGCNVFNYDNNNFDTMNLH
jgi:hypothetical protein